MRQIEFKTGHNKGHYSPGVISNGMLYISGQLSIDLESRKTVQGGIREHIKQSLMNVEKVLQAAQLNKENIVFCRIYITNINDWDQANEEYALFFGNHKPARIVVTSPALHFGCLCEIEAIAEVGE